MMSHVFWALACLNGTSMRLNIWLELLMIRGALVCENMLKFYFDIRSISVADPDPPGSDTLAGSGSGSGSEMAWQVGSLSVVT